MSYDVNAAISGYVSFFNNFKNEIQNIKTQLDISYNFGRNPTDTNFEDFWSILVDPSVLPYTNFESQYSNIITNAQFTNNLINESFMNLLGMVSQLDNYICYASDSLSRAVDTAWSFGNGSIYNAVYGIYDTETGTHEIIKPGLEYYKSKISEIIINMSNLFGLMDSSKFNDAEYLIDFRDNKFLPEIEKLPDILSKVFDELNELVTLAIDHRKVFELWLPTCFKMLTTVSLAFNLGKKIMKIGNKGLIDNSPLTLETRIGLSVAKYWRTKVLPDRSNFADCLTEALLLGFRSIEAPGMLEAFIDKTWENNIPKY